jgi:phosphopentomutase
VGDRALVFTNLVDFDSHFGHRRDPRGYAEALSELDAWVPEALAALGPDDQLWITADHGCDPTWRGSDHTREDSPLIIAGPEVAANVLHPGDTLADIAATLADAFQVAPPGVGRSVWREVTTTHA